MERTTQEDGRSGWRAGTAAPPPRGAWPQRLRWNYRTRRMLAGYIFLLPNILGFLAFTAIPIVAALLVSFTDWNLVSAPYWVGFENYRSLLIEDATFRRALQNTLLFVVGTVPLRVLFSLLSAVALNQRIRGITSYRTAYFLPVVSDAVAISFVWVWIFDPNVGLLNYLLRSLGLPVVPNWTASTTWALPAVMIVDLWKNIGFTTVIYLAGLQGIPQNLYDAADIDGASLWQKFRYITVPMISPTTFFVTIMSLIWAWQTFEIPYAMFQGGPARATTTLALYIYTTGFTYRRMGEAAAIAWILFAVIFLFTVIQTRLQRRWVHYEVEA